MGKLAETVETVLKIGGGLAVLGFISLRTHLSLLGVKWDTALGTEKYLTEGYQLVYASVEILLNYAPVVLKYLLPFIVLAFLLRKRPLIRNIAGAIRNISGLFRFDLLYRHA